MLDGVCAKNAEPRCDATPLCDGATTQDEIAKAVIRGRGRGGRGCTSKKKMVRTKERENRSKHTTTEKE